MWLASRKLFLQFVLKLFDDALHLFVRCKWRTWREIFTEVWGFKYRVNGEPSLNTSNERKEIVKVSMVSQTSCNCGSAKPKAACSSNGYSKVIWGIHLPVLLSLCFV